MKKFRYRLQPLLDLRAYHEQEWEIKLAEVTGRCVLLKKEIEELEAEKTGLGSGPEAGFDMGVTIAVDLYRQRLIARIADLREVLARTETERKKVETSYFAASRDRKIIDKLKERKADEYRIGRLRNEAKVLDDVAGAGPAREIIRE